MGAKKSAHFFLMGALKKKKEGQSPFFENRFLGALLPNKPTWDWKIFFYSSNKGFYPRKTEDNSDIWHCCHVFKRIYYRLAHRQEI